jgi:hypothetical protein
MLALYIYGIVAAFIWGLLAIRNSDDNQCTLSNKLCLVIVVVVSAGSWFSVLAYGIELIVQYVIKPENKK